jgi:hypothetical protein
MLRKLSTNFHYRLKNNVLYDIGGEIQNILEENYIYKNTVNTDMHEAFDKMLGVIINRVKDIEDGSKLMVIISFRYICF